MSNVFAEFMKEVGAYPKLRFTEGKKELIFVGATHTKKVDPADYCRMEGVDNES